MLFKFALSALVYKQINSYDSSQPCMAQAHNLQIASVFLASSSFIASDLSLRIQFHTLFVDGKKNPNIGSPHAPDLCAQRCQVNADLEGLNNLPVGFNVITTVPGHYLGHWPL